MLLKQFDLIFSVLIFFFFFSKIELMIYDIALWEIRHYSNVQ